MKEFLRVHTPGLFNFIKRTKYLILTSGEGCPLVFNFRSYSANNFIRSIIKIFVTPFMIIKYFFPVKDLKREGLAIVLIAKDEAQLYYRMDKFSRQTGGLTLFYL
ncbi:MAG: hypothetical protein IJT21_04465 [Synergistaceae bacterium]|nr:hypothetical protein [Synergistaceae bacterium]